MKDIEAIILAGGRGSRMGSLTVETQKCLLPIEGKPALGYIMESLATAFGSVDLKIGVSHQSGPVKEYVSKNKPNKVTVTYVPHKTHWEGWDIYNNIRQHIRGTFVALPGDVLALPEAYTKVATLFENSKANAAMTLSPDVEEVDTHGVGKIDSQQVVELSWPPPSNLENTHLRDMTIWASDKGFFDVIEKYPNPGKSIGFVFMEAIRQGQHIAGNKYELPWVHIGYPEDLKKKLPENGIIYTRNSDLNLNLV